MISNVLKEVQNATGLSSDKVNAVGTLFLSIPLACIFRAFFNTRRVTVTTRHWISLLWGVALLTLCFGRQSLHLFICSMASFVTMHVATETAVHWCMLVVCMTYLSIVHISRVFGQTVNEMDITAPLMIATIKISYIGCHVFDTCKRNQVEGTKDSSKPTFLEYSSYIFNFSSVLCGPPSEYVDYKEFIEDRVFREEVDKLNHSPLFPALRKLLFGCLMVIMYGLYSSNYHPNKLAGQKARLEEVKTSKSNEKRFADGSIFSLYLFAEQSLLFKKMKYYAAFFLGEAVSNLSGLGFGKNTSNWDKLTSAHPVDLELARSIPEVVSSWNVLSAKWLKKCIYKRFTFQPFLFTWIFSALWHGFYPGYYWFFIPSGVVIYIGRKLRRKVTPYFQTSRASRLVYELITWSLCRVLICFYSAAFTMLDMRATLVFWRLSYHVGHLIIAAGLVLVVVLPDVEDARENSTKEK